MAGQSGVYSLSVPCCCISMTSMGVLTRVAMTFVGNLLGGTIIWFVMLVSSSSMGVVSIERVTT